MPVAVLPHVEAKLGCDPEIFIRKKVRGRKAIVPSVVLLPDGKLAVSKLSYGDPKFNPQIVRDGVQVELHPEPFACRANLSNSLQNVFKALKKSVEKAGLEIDFSGTVRLTKAEMRRLDPESIKLGCMPSLNAYGREWVEKDGSRYPWRSGGGHIHIDLFSSDAYTTGVRELQIKRNRSFDLPALVRWLDLLVGLPCVLLDRDPLNVQRRKLYGRAGEYRTPPHGLEYRTLSNFWLRSYPLMSMVFGMTHNALNMWPATLPPATSEEITAFNKKQQWGYTHSSYIQPTADSPLRPLVEAALLCPLDLLEQAINKNDFALATELYQQFVKPLWLEITSTRGVAGKVMVEAFEWVVKEGIHRVWDHDPVQHWATKREGHYGGWESFALDQQINGFKPLVQKGQINGTDQHPTPTA